MANLTYAQLKQVWLNAAKGTQYDNNQWASLMAAIAEAESGGDPNDVNPNDNHGRQSSYGLWQISTGTHAEPSPAWNDPESNAKLAIGKLNSQGLRAWGTYDSGAYKAYLNNSTTPAGVGAAGAAAGADVSGGQTGAAVAASGRQVAAAVAAMAATESDCAWKLEPFSSGLIASVIGKPSWCILSWSQIRAIMSTGILLAGGAVFLFGTAALLSTTAPGQAITRVATRVAGVARLAA